MLLLTPCKSLFLWAPALVLAVTRGRRLWQTERRLAVGLLAAFGTALVFYGSYLFPEGGYAHGPRQLVPLVPLLLLPAANPAAPSPGRVSLVLSAIVGAAIAALSVSVSFLEDQALGANPGASATTSYYELIDPAPGRAGNRYVLGYMPFVRALGTPEWTSRARLGVGPDYFPYQLDVVRRGRGGDVIPYALPRLLPVPFVALLVWGAAGIRSRFRA